MSFIPRHMLSPLDDRYASDISDLADLFSELSVMKERLGIEIHWLLSLEKTPLSKGKRPISPHQKKDIRHWYENFSVEAYQEIKALEQETKHDVKAIEIWLGMQLKSYNLEDHIPLIHIGCTSEDINNLAYGRLIQKSHAITLSAIDDIIQWLSHQSKVYAYLPMLGRTHGQAATPTTLGKELANFAYRLIRAREHLKSLSFFGKINGAVGNLNALTFVAPEFDWLAHVKQTVESLSLTFNPYTTQVENKDYIAVYLGHLAHLNTIATDFSKDMWLYHMQGYWRSTKTKKEVGSSTMPHKVNPIHFDNAEGNLEFANTLLSFLMQRLPLSRLQRDLSDSTLMRNIGLSIGHSVLAYRTLMRGLSKIEPNIEQIKNDLNMHWEILAEAIQTLMRARGVTNAYDIIKEKTHGAYKMTPMAYAQLVQSLCLSDEDKQSLLSLSPFSYLGIAPQLATELSVHF